MLDGIALRLLHEIADTREFRILFFTEPERSRLIRAVGVHPAAHVEKHGHIFFEFLFSGYGVGQGTVFPEGDNARESQLARSVFAEIAFDHPGDFRLCHAFPDLTLDPFEHGVIDRERFFKGGDFFRFLDEPELFDHTVAGFKSEPLGKFFGKGGGNGASLKAYP